MTHFSISSHLGHQLALSGGDGLSDANRPVWRNHATVGQDLAGVVEDDDPVAQQAPALLGVEGDGVRRVTVRVISWRTWGLMRTHCCL